MGWTETIGSTLTNGVHDESQLTSEGTWHLPQQVCTGQEELCWVQLKNTVYCIIISPTTMVLGTRSRV